jgi:hypothetical protein
MKTTTYRHENVLPDGTFSDKRGAVHTTPVTTMSYDSPRGGCGLPHCGCSPGHWISINKGRTDDGVVEGYNIKFDNKDEMDQYLLDNGMERPIRLEK